MKRRGYALLMVLMLLAIAALLSVGLARQSIETTQTAALKASDLQDRWGRISIRHSVLNRAEILLRTEELRIGMPVSRLETTFELGGNRIRLLLADEQAKLNLNMVHRQGSLAAVERNVRMFSSADFPVWIRPHGNAGREGDLSVAFSGFAQIYDWSDSSRLIRQDHLRVMQLGTQLSCWGNGQLNVSRADTDVFRVVCDLLVSPDAASTLITLREKNPDWKMDRLFKEADLSDPERRLLRRHMTERSRCHSLWTLVEGTGCRLDVLGSDASVANQVVSFEF